MNKLVLTTEMIVSLLHWDFISLSSQERLQFFKKDKHMIYQQTLLHALIT